MTKEEKAAAKAEARDLITRTLGADAVPEILRERD